MATKVSFDVNSLYPSVMESAHGDYGDKWTEVKTKASIKGNEGMRTIAKLQLNSLYGKMASNPVK